MKADYKNWVPRGMVTGFAAGAAALAVGVAGLIAAIRKKTPRKENAVWNLYAPVYDLFMRQNRAAYEEMYAKIRSSVKGGRVLELCTGTGLIAKHIASAASEVVATDFAEKMLAEARKGGVPANVTFERADATALPFADAGFDAVVIANALHIIPNPERALAEARRILRSGGVLIAPNFLGNSGGGKEKALAKFLTAAGVVFELKWDAAGYLAFLEENGWRIKNHVVLRASFPLCYTECEAVE